MKNNNSTTYHQDTTVATIRDAVPATDTLIEKGATLLDLYKVESDPIVGGGVIFI